MNCPFNAGIYNKDSLVVCYRIRTERNYQYQKHNRLFDRLAAYCLLRVRKVRVQSPVKGRVIPKPLKWYQYFLCLALDIKREILALSKYIYIYIYLSILPFVRALWKIDLCQKAPSLNNVETN